MRITSKQINQKKHEQTRKLRKLEQDHYDLQSNIAELQQDVDKVDAKMSQLGAAVVNETCVTSK